MLRNALDCACAKLWESLGMKPGLLQIAALWLSLAALAAAEDWDVMRVDGRDYLTLENIAKFYGMSAPPPVPAEPAPMPPPTATPEESALFSAAPAPRTISVQSDKMQLEVSLNSREIVINGAKQWLAFPAHVQNGQVLISRLDLVKVIEPRLRPERIEGLQPVETVVLDPGHGGHDKGAVSRYGYEKDFALDVALRARKLLEARGFKVAMTRTTDIFIPLEERPRLAKALPNSIFVSIHFNASDANHDARGFEIFSMAPRGAPATNDAIFTPRVVREEPGNAHELPSAALAGAVYHSLLGQVPTVDRGLKHARFAVLRLSTVPAVLVECGFVTNLPESMQISSPAWRERVAEAIAEGIDGYKELAVHKQAPKLVADYRRATPGTPDSTAPSLPVTPPQ